MLEVKKRWASAESRTAAWRSELLSASHIRGTCRAPTCEEDGDNQPPTRPAAAMTGRGGFCGLDPHSDSPGKPEDINIVIPSRTSMPHSAPTPTPSRLTLSAHKAPAVTTDGSLVDKLGQL
uniref:Uncharacterized protein n=1 Tax=Knipowitschia caucasica TaxID=637954 RepID=A0AAV2K7E3_KNICA